MTTMPSAPLIIPVILSGGSGTRLWPLSTAEQPKQFLPLTGAHSMFRQTLERSGDRTRFAAPLIICGPGHVGHVSADLAAAGIADAQIIVEPAARNTAPAIALAAHAALAMGATDAPILVMPSDHVMTDVPAFLAAVQAALPAVRGGALATFGIRPSAPETGYGYIAQGAALADCPGVAKVDRFVEKPERARAEEMLAAGHYLWNAGIFLMRADAFLSELSTHGPEMAQSCAQSMADPAQNGLCIHPHAAAFMASPSNSIDYAVMERAANVVVVPVDPGWSDVGSWTALHALAEQDADGNALSGDILSIDNQNCLLRAESGLRIAALGVENLIVIASGTDVLLIPMDRAQDIKQIVDALKNRG